MLMSELCSWWLSFIFFFFMKSQF